MARKTKTVRIDDPEKLPDGSLKNRDHGKLFVITEMPARQAEKWATRALLALAKSGVDIPSETIDQGAAAIISAGALSFATVAWEDAEPLLDEMMDCVAIARDPKHPDFTQPLGDDEPEEITTRFKLRAEVIELHTGFPVAALLSTLGAAAKSRVAQSDTPTSPAILEPSSVADLPPTTN